MLGFEWFDPSSDPGEEEPGVEESVAMLSPDSASPPKDDEEECKEDVLVVVVLAVGRAVDVLEEEEAVAIESDGDAGFDDDNGDEGEVGELEEKVMDLEERWEEEVEVVVVAGFVEDAKDTESVALVDAEPATAE